MIIDSIDPLKLPNITTLKRLDPTVKASKETAYGIALPYKIIHVEITAVLIASN